MVGKKTSGLRPFVETLLPALPNDIIELDELWTFVVDKLHKVWLWTAVCRRTQQVVAYHLGDRDEKSCRQFYAKIPAQYAACCSRSDFFKSYSIISSYTHKMCGKETGETAHVEAFNTILRQRVGRLVRKTCSFSKSKNNHEAAISCFIQDHNMQYLSVK